MHLQRLALVLAVAVASFSLPRIAHACSCLRPPPPGEAANQSAAVFEATILGNRKDPNSTFGEILVSMQVDRMIKSPEGAPPGSTVDVRTADNSAACGREFEVGQRYLVYSSARDAEVFLDNACSRTAKIADAAADLAALADWTPGASSGSEPPKEEPDAPAVEPEPVIPAQDPTPAPTATSRGCAVDRSGSPLLFGFAILLMVGLGRRRAA